MGKKAGAICRPASIRCFAHPAILQIAMLHLMTSGLASGCGAGKG